MQMLLQIARKIVTNFYLGTSTIFLIWITFFDGNDLISLFSNRMKLAEAESDIAYYQERIDMVLAEQARLHGNPDAIERFAREKFLMKKEDEDVFVFPEEANNSIFDRLIGF
jgi:cell division protein DivIC